MGYSAVPTVAPGDAWSAAQHNTYVRDNFAAIWKGQAAGDLDWYISNSAKDRLAKPAVDSVLTMGAAGTPSWLDKTTLPGSAHKNAFSQADLGGYAVPGDGAWHSYRSVGITTTKVCTIVISVMAAGAVNMAGESLLVGVQFDASADTGAGVAETSNPYYVPMTLNTYWEHVAAAAHTVYLLALQGGSGGLLGRVRIVVHAIKEE